MSATEKMKAKIARYMQESKGNARNAEDLEDAVNMLKEFTEKDSLFVAKLYRLDCVRTMLINEACCDECDEQIEKTQMKVADIDFLIDAINGRNGNISNMSIDRKRRAMLFELGMSSEDFNEFIEEKGGIDFVRERISEFDADFMKNIGQEIIDTITKYN